MVLEYHLLQNLVDMENNKYKWKGHLLNTSDIGYDTDFYEPKVLTGSTTGPYNPIEVTETPKEDRK